VRASADLAEPAAGRRDRKKNETREALRAAAHRLFAEKGFSRTTIDDITDAADVSRRTFFRYYGSKDDLLRTDVADLLPVMLAALRSRPADEPPLMAILAALRILIGPDGPPALAESLASPAGGIRARLSLLRLLAEWEQGIADTLLARSGLASPDERDRLRAVVNACAATSALRASAQIYRSRYPGRGLDTTRLLPIIEQAFAVLSDSSPGKHDHLCSGRPSSRPAADCQPPRLGHQSRGLACGTSLAASLRAHPADPRR
jgi:AcrR family transcriptional regulator